MDVLGRVPKFGMSHPDGLELNSKNSNSLPPMTRNIDVHDSDVESLKEVGPIRAMRLERDLDITRITEIADAEIETLTAVWSIGEWTAQVIRGSAQGYVQAFDIGHKEHVLVVLGQTAPRGMDGEQASEVIETAFADAGIDPSASATKVATLNQGRNDDFPDPDEVVEMWARRESTYEKSFAPRYEQHAQAVDAFREQRERAIGWADQLIVPVTGQYTSFILKEAKRNEVEATVGEIRRGHLADVEWDPETDIQQAQFVSNPATHDGDDPEVDPEWEQGATPGREGDIEDPVDKYLTLKPNDRDEARLDRNDLDGADPGGDGDPSSGKKSWSTGS